MMKRLVTVAALAAFACAGVATVPASAQVAERAPASEPGPPPADTADVGAEGAGEDGDKVVCRTVKPPTGTRVSSGRSRQRRCMTKDQWEQEAREAQEFLKLRDSGVCGGISADGGGNRCSG